MYQFLKKNSETTWLIILTFLLIGSFLLVLVVFKNNEKLEKTQKENHFFENNELISVKEFLLSKINSPFFNINYEIKNGDSIQKILQKFKIPNNQIQKVIFQYKKYSNPNQLMAGNEIDIIIEKNLIDENNTITKFSVSTTKSTTIEIKKDDEGNITSKKSLLNFIKKRFLPKI